MKTDIYVNGVSVVISLEHVTEPGEGWQASTFIAECGSMNEVNIILNDPKKQPPPYWQWKIDFQDKE